MYGEGLGDDSLEWGCMFCDCVMDSVGPFFYLFCSQVAGMINVGCKYLEALSILLVLLNHFSAVCLVLFEGCRSCHSFCAYRCFPGFMNIV